ncbi:vesicle-associated membrane protein-associated protein A-like [Limulus polyphemus]|uniref:Vesicle-associated membrane protein-associated protein A-like n=1 Tax=Limulus polyphemus TaxID=6850 RepID=A0ABM1BAZ3_LIMPO|nr:vesicle-associated membrane protein-associated protein A-like [Limulus polyphemus]
MSKPQQILQLEPPSELHFKGPFTDVTTSNLTLYNPSEWRVCFKIKTTTPKRYCVRPNSGIIEPKQHMTVSVMLQPFDYDPHEKLKHKFMVQTMIAPEGDCNLETVWKYANSENLMDSKLRCVFDLPSEEISQNNLDSNIGHVEDNSPLIKLSSDPLPKPSPKATNTDQLLKKVQDEHKMLKDELVQLQQENSKLKEEGLRQRLAHNTVGSSPVPRKVDFYQADNIKSASNIVPSTGSLELQQQPSVMLMALIIGACLLGFFMGKFIL